MDYPIFDAIVKHIENELKKRYILIDSLRVWNETGINARGIEMSVHLDNYSTTMKNMIINMDWDKFREAKLASSLSGMNNHPFLKEGLKNLDSIKPVLDVEVIWNLNPEIIMNLSNEITATSRLNWASEWMDNINKRSNFLLGNEDVMTRWHVEFEGDLNGRYVSNMSLITYYQVSLSESQSISDINSAILKRLKRIQNITRKLVFLTSDCLPKALSA
jgi:hypothetical protein